MDKILQCPFCEGENLGIQENAATLWVQCMDCNARGPEADKAGRYFKAAAPDAIAAWNQRAAADSAVTGQLQQLSDSISKVLNQNLKPENKVAKISALMDGSGKK